MEKRTKILYRLVGLQAKQSGFVERDLGQVFLDLGLHGIAISSDVNIYRSANHTPHADIRFVSAKKFELIRVYTIKGILRIELNLNHPLVKVLRQERLSKSVGMAIVASYARAIPEPSLARLKRLRVSIALPMESYEALKLLEAQGEK